MDFSPDELDVSPPCFLVENSQDDESQQLGRSDSQILKHLPIFRLSSRTDSSADNSNDSSVPRHPVALTCPTAGGEGVGKVGGDPSRDGDQQGQGGNRSGGGDDRGGGGDNGGGGGDGGGDGHAGGGGNGGRDDDDDNENNGQDPSTNEEESPHSEQQSSSPSSDTIPKLIRPETIVSNNDQRKGQKFVVRDAPLSGPVTSHGSGSSVHESSDNYSQASTGIVGEGRDVGADVTSEASTATVEEERKSTSSCSIGKTWVAQHS